MKNIFIKCFFALCVLFALVSCDSKRPGTSENFVIDVAGTSILKNAEVTLYSEGKEVAKTNTDEDGKFEMKDVSSATGLNISVCKGAFHSVASEKDVDFTGCLETYIPVAQENISAVVDFLSTFISKYDETLEEKTALEEWSEYLSMTTSPAPELQEALTDATKRYLWQQGLSKLAEQVSQANNITPESMFSTENLFNLLIADLVDDSIINGSTKTKIGNMDINALVLKNYIADAIPKVSETFSAADLSEWTDKIRYSDAKFLGGEGKGSTNNEINISLDVYPEGSKGAHPDFYSGNVIVEAAAEPATLVVSLKCYAGESEIPNDLDKKDQFEGSFSTLEIENDTVLKIRCDASDGVSIKSVEKEITINNDAPITTATLFESGTNIVTGTAENPAKSRVDLKVEAKHAKYNIDEVVCSLENYTLKNTATANYQFAAVIDTTELPEGTNTLKCTATMNQNKFSSEFDFIVRNTVIVTVKPFVVNPLSEIKSVDVDCGENFKGHYTALQDISLKRGQICTITVSGGKFQSVTLESIKEFGSSLSSVVIPESDADIIITPATTIDEIVYSSRVSAGEDAAETFEKSKDSLLKHFSQAFSWNTEPKNTQSMDATTKYYILLAGLENLAYFMEMQINTNHGAYNIGNIIDLLRDDYSDLTFDGAKNGSKLVFGTENKFELDANFFRYYYATAIKRFLASDFNATGITNIGSILNQISTNSDQYLFPANSETIAIESDGPIITIDSFKNLRPYREEDGNSEDYIDGELATYMPLGEETGYLETTSEKQPYFAQAFILNFTVKSNNGNYIDLNSVKISGNGNEVFGFTRLSPAEIQGDGFTDKDTEFSFLVEYDGHNQPKNEKQLEFTVSAEDVAFNGGSAAVKAFLDSKEPTIDLLGDKTATNGADDFKIIYDILDGALVKISYCLDKVTTETDGETGDEIATATEIKCWQTSFETPPSESYLANTPASKIKEYIETAAADGTITETDGDYIFRITASDRAGNSYTGIKEFRYDTTPPAAPQLVFDSYPDNTSCYYGCVTNGNFLSLALSEYSDDVAKWQLEMPCKYYGENNEVIQTSGFVAADEVAAVTNLLTPSTSSEISVCSIKVTYCDEVDNCGVLTFADDAWFIDNQPPQFNSVDETNSILSECVAESSSGSGMFPGLHLPQCLDSPNCLTEDGVLSLGTHQAQLLVEFEDSILTDSFGLNVEISNNSIGTRQCNAAGNGGCTNKYYCNIEGSAQGQNTYVITATDIAGNKTTVNKTYTFAAGVENPKLTLTRSFFTEKTNSVLSWTAKNGITYTCSIKKSGDEDNSTGCSNGTTINSGKLWGSGKYYVVLTAKNSAGVSRDYQIYFTYFNTNDLTATFTPIKNQMLSNGETFKFSGAISSKDNLAQITKIEYSLYGLYKDGNSYDSVKYLFKTWTPTSPASSLNATVTATLNLDAYGQFRNLSAKIFFADGASIIKNSTQSAANSFLFCKLGTSESLNNVTITYSKPSYTVKYKKPACFATSDYTINLVTYQPNCSNDVSTTQSITYSDLDTQFLLNSSFTPYTLNHMDSSGGIGRAASCQAKEPIYTLSKNTKIQINYKASNKTYNVGNLSDTWNNIPISWQHQGGTAHCSKCNNAPSTITCTDGTKTIKKLH